MSDGCPIFVSSRAAGVTESNGTVTIKKLFTYDAVADPGFSSAKMELKTVNESLGYTNENCNFRIYDMSDSKINELFNMNNNDFVTKTDLSKYSEYLKTEIETLNMKIMESAKNGITAPEDIVKMSELLEAFKEQQSQVEKYMDYLTETIQLVVNENNDLRKRTEQIIEHNNYLAETVEHGIKYTEHVATIVNESIDYTQYVAETLDKSIEFVEYVAENTNNSIEYGQYLAENLDNSIIHSDYLAEQLENGVSYIEYLAEHLDNSIDYVQYVVENVQTGWEELNENITNVVKYGEYLAEHLDNSIEYGEYLAEHTSNNQAFVKYLAENLDITIDAIKSSKINEGFNFDSMLNEDDIQRFYNDNDEDMIKRRAQGQSQIQTQTQTQVQNIPSNDDVQETQPIVSTSVQEPINSQEEIQHEIQQEVQEPINSQESELTEVQPIEGVVGAQPIPGESTEPISSVEGLPIQDEVQIEVGGTYKFEDKPVEVIAHSPEEKITVIRDLKTNSELKVESCKLIKLEKNIEDKDTSLTKYVENLITETKKRKASETQEPHFVSFLTEKNKKAFNALSSEDKEKVVFAINESTNYYNESDVLKLMTEALTPKKSFDEILIENIPSDLKPVWEKMNENHKKTVLSQASLFPNLDNSRKMESFWGTRQLERYLSVNEKKTVLNENVLSDNSKLSEQQLDSILSKLKNLGV